MVGKLVLEFLSDKVELTKEERQLFDRARELAWKDILEMYKRKCFIR